MSAPSPQPVVAHQKVFTTNWHENWADCTKDSDACLMSWCCPCVQFGKNYVAISNPRFGERPETVVSRNDCGVLCGCAVWLCAAYFAGPLGTGLMGCFNRTNLRAKYNISTGECADSCSDCCISACCTCCALSQEWRELNWRQDQPMTIAVPGGVIIGTTITAGAVVPGATVAQPPMGQAQIVYGQPQPQQFQSPPPGQAVQMQPTQYAYPQQPPSYGQPQEQGQPFQQAQYPQQQQPYAPQYNPAYGQPAQQPYGAPQYGAQPPQVVYAQPPAYAGQPSQYAPPPQQPYVASPSQPQHPQQPAPQYNEAPPQQSGHMIR